MGHIEIWGQTVPSLLAMAGRAIKEVTEKIPLSGFKLKDSVVFGLTAKTAESIEALADSIVFGTTRFQSDDLQSSLDESVTITNI